MRRARLISLVLAAALIAVIVAVGLGQAGKNSAPKEQRLGQAEIDRALAGSPQPLKSLHAQANKLLSGDTRTVKQRIGALRGYPVVINKWASWCGPCKFEFPFFQQLAVKQGKRLAVFGLNSGDNEADAQAFLGKFPVTYPSYKDPNEQIAQALGIGNNYPVTVFYDRHGKVAYIHQGGYASSKKLLADVRRYAR